MGILNCFLCTIGGCLDTMRRTTLEVFFFLNDFYFDTYRTRPIKKWSFCNFSEPWLFQFTIWFALKFIQTDAHEEIQLSLELLSVIYITKTAVKFSKFLSKFNIFFAVFSRIIRAKFVKDNDVIPLSILTYSNLGELIVGLDRPWNGKDRLHIPLQTIQCAGWCWWLRISSELPNFLISQHRACCGEDQKIIWQKSRDLRQDDPRSKLQGRQNWKRIC